MNFFFRKKKKIIKENNNIPINKKNFKAFIVKAIGFAKSQGEQRGEFEEPDFDFEEIKIASKSDSYIKMALMKFSYLIYKAGTELNSTNNEAIEYIKTRFRIMSFSTQKPIDVLFQEIGDDILTYSNGFLVKSRIAKIPFGIKAKGVLNTNPVGGYFRLDPITVKIKRDEHGTIQKYVQRLSSGEEKEFSPTEIIHFYIDKEASSAYGTPRFLAALEDVKLLRRIEGNVISLIYRFAIPIYQWIIGKPEKGFEATDTEIDDARNEIENLPLDGTIVTNEKTAIKAIGAEGEALDASKYLEYFEKRVLSALGVSETQMGRGTAKQNADSMEQQAHDTVKYIQKALSIFIENYILNELLLEGGFNPLLNENDIVKYEFNEISLETKIKKENHEMLKFQSNIITFDEVRNSLGKKSNIDINDLFVNKIKSNDDNDDDNDDDINDTKSDLKTRNTPKNQHGTYSVKVKEKILETEKLKKSNLRSKKEFKEIYSKFYKLRDSIISDTDKIEDLILLSKKDMMTSVLNEINKYSIDGIADAVNEIKTFNINKSYHTLYPNFKLDLNVLEKIAENSIDKLLNDIKLKCYANKKQSDILLVFKSLEYRLNFIINYILPKTYWYSYIKTGNFLNVKKAYIDFDGSKDEKDHKKIINTNDFRIEDIPAFHPFCDCKVNFINKGR